MANNLYDKGREKFLGTATGQINWTNDVIKCVLIDGTYPGGQAVLTTHEFYSDIAGFVIPGVSVCKSLTTKTTSRTVGATYTGGVAGADPISFTAVETGHVLAFLCLFKDSDHAGSGAIDGEPLNPEDSPLIALLDTVAGIGITTNGGDIAVTWDAVNKIFKL